MTLSVDWGGDEVGRLVAGKACCRVCAGEAFLVWVAWLAGSLLVFVLVCLADACILVEARFSIMAQASLTNLSVL